MKIPKPLIILLALIIILQAFSLIYMMSFKNKVDAKLNENLAKVNNFYSSYNSSIESIRRDIGNIERDIEMNDSILEDIKIEVSSYDYNKLSHKVNITVIPKEISDDTKVYFSIDDFYGELTKIGTSYSATFEQELEKSFDEKGYTDYLVSIESSGVKKSEKGHIYLQNNLSEIFPSIIPVIFIDGREKEKYYFSVDTMTYQIYNTQQYFNFADLCFYKNGVLISKEAIKLDSNHNFDDEEMIGDSNFSTSADDGDEIEFKIFAETDRGFLYDITLCRYIVKDGSENSSFSLYNPDSGDSFVDMFESFVIRDKDNNIIYETNRNGINNN